MISNRIAAQVGLVLLFAVSSPRVQAAEDSVPKLEGTWTWEWKEGEGKTHHHTLVIEGEGATLSAQERFDDEEAIKVEDFKVDGKSVTFSVTRGERRASYSGKITDDDTMNGMVNVTVAEDPANEFTWTAKRKAVEKP